MTSFLRRFCLVSGILASFPVHPDISGASLHLSTMTDYLRLSSNRLPEPGLTAPLPFMREGRRSEYRKRDESSANCEKHANHAKFAITNAKVCICAESGSIRKQANGIWLLKKSLSFLWWCLNHHEPFWVSVLLIRLRRRPQTRRIVESRLGASRIPSCVRFSSYWTSDPFILWLVMPRVVSFRAGSTSHFVRALRCLVPVAEASVALFSLPSLVG